MPGHARSSSRPSATTTAGAGLLAVMQRDGIDTSHVATRSGVPTGRALIGVGDSGENSIIVVPARTPPCTSTNSPPRPSCSRSSRSRSTRFAAPSSSPAPPARPRCSTRRPRRRCRPTCWPCATSSSPTSTRSNSSAVSTRCSRSAHERSWSREGSRGATLYRDGGAGTGEHIAPFPVSPVDTTGAGDTFCGSLCARLAAGDDLVVALRWAAAAAALEHHPRRCGAVDPARRGGRRVRHRCRVTAAHPSSSSTCDHAQRCSASSTCSWRSARMPLMISEPFGPSTRSSSIDSSTSVGRQDVRDHHVVGADHLLQQRGGRDDVVGDAVAHRVLVRHRLGGRRDVDRIGVLGAEADRRDREHPRPAADVEHAYAIGRVHDARAALASTAAWSDGRPCRTWSRARW